MKTSKRSQSAAMLFHKAFAGISTGLCLMMGLLNVNLSYAQSTMSTPEQVALEERVKSNLKENAQTIRFLENKGQIDNKDVLYYFQSKKGSVYIERGRIRFVAIEEKVVSPAHEEDEEDGFAELFAKYEEEEVHHVPTAAHTFSVYMDGSNLTPRLKLGDSFSTNFNYIMGSDPKGWVSGVKAAKDLTLEDIYPGIDLRLYSNSDGTMEFDWVMDAGADYSKVNLRFEGQDGLNVTQDGSLEVGLRFTDVKFHIPESYQVTEHGKAPVNFSFHKSNENTIDFATQDKIDPRFPLIIDPVLAWGTFMDGNDDGFDQYLFAVQVDLVSGIVYCAGATNINIPTGAAPYDANGYLNAIAGFDGTGATPRTAIVYRMNGTGTDLLDLTLYGPATVDGSDNAVAYALSLSTNRVFIGGHTNIDLPTTGTPFDATRNADDGFVAVFSKDLGTLVYATYLGSTGDDFPGVTTVRALSDDSYVFGMTVTAALPAGPAAPDYNIGAPADATYGGSQEMYIAKFTTFNALSWGSYVGSGDNEFFQDLEVFGDGRVAFVGYGNGDQAEVNSAATESTNTNNTDGIIGVLNNTGTAFNYLDEIGGGGDAGEDRLNDVEISGETLYFVGGANVGAGPVFPVTVGAYDVSHNGAIDGVVGSVSAAGTTGYTATFYGSASDEVASGLKFVTTTQCGGAQSSFLLVFGSTEGSPPTQNINAESFFKTTNSGGLDIFFAGFKADMTGPLQFGTLMGGSENDYLGDTGDPRGANHLWVNGSNVYVGTTTHSTTHTPALVGNGGFDTVKSNTNDPASDDAHIIFSIQFNSILESDYSDAPATYGTPFHNTNCANLRIGLLLDPEGAAIPSTLANGDDLSATDDEDGVTTVPSFSDGGPQNISVTVVNITNTTGSTANLYGWIDLDGDGQFEVGEIATNTVPNGSMNVSVMLTWTGVTVSGPAAAHYLRVRLTTTALADVGGTAAVDERSTVSATNGEVEDYRAIDLTCPTQTTLVACQSQAQIHTAFLAWLASVKAGGGCNDGILTDNSPVEPLACVGGTANVTFTYTSSCAPLTTTCMSSFTVPADAPPLISACAVTRNINGCNTGAITSPPFNTNTTASTEAVFEGAPNNGNVTDDCGIISVTYIDVTTGTCPIVVTRKWTVSDACGHSSTCNQTINVQDNSSTAPVILACAVTRNIEGCNTGAITNPPYSTTTAASSEAVFEGAPNNGNASDNCGITAVNYIDVATGTCPTVVTRKWTITDACGNSSTCNQTINVNDTAAPSILACAATRNIESCGGTDGITSPPYSTTTAASSEAEFEGAPNNGNASDACGITSVTYIDMSSGTCPTIVTRKWTVTDACGHSSTCNQTINVNDSSNPTINACAVTRNVEGCDVSYITNPPYSATPAVSSEEVFENAPNNGNASDACGSLTVTYVDVAAGTCPTVVTRKWTVTDACGHSSTCNQTINVNDTTSPTIVACAATRSIQGCDVSYILNPPYSAVPVASTEAVFESAPNNGNASDACGITTVTYVDVATGTCPTNVTRKWTVTDACGHSSTCLQSISVNDTSNPVINACAVTRNIEGCSLAAITNPPYSATPVASTEAVFENAPNNGNASDACGITSVTYVDVPTGICPIVVTRTWTLTDACGHSATCGQTINVDDTVNPVIAACAGTRNIQGCSLAAITSPPFSATLAVSSEAVFESAPNNGNTSDACGVTSVTYIDVAAGTCPTVVSRKWTVSDACGNSSTCIQTINVDDNINPIITFCPGDLELTCDPEADNLAIIQAWLATATATDACDGNVDIDFDYDGISIPEFTCEGFVGGGLHIRITATDDCGNTATCIATVSKPCFDIDAHIYIEGSAVNPNGANSYSVPMRTTLNNVRVLPGQTLVDPFVGIKYTPPGQPYSGAPWFYPGTEGSLFDSGGNPMFGNAGYPPTVVDWVLVSLRNDSAGTGGPVCQAAALLHSDGHLQFVQPLDCCDVTESNDYYITIEHRDHLIVMSDIKVSFFSHKLNFDFRDHQSYVNDPLMLGLFAREKEIMPGIFAMFTGDGDQSTTLLSDTNINADDRSTWVNQNGQVGQYRLGDYNMNGDTNLNDRVVWERNNPRFTSVPRD